MTSLCGVFSTLSDQHTMEVRENEAQIFSCVFNPCLRGALSESFRVQNILTSSALFLGNRGFWILKAPRLLQGMYSASAHSAHTKCLPSGSYRTSVNNTLWGTEVNSSQSTAWKVNENPIHTGLGSYLTVCFPAQITAHSKSMKLKLWMKY